MIRIGNSRTPISFTAKCIDCRHEWSGAKPPGPLSLGDDPCPKCGSTKGADIKIGGTINVTGSTENQA